MSHEDIKALSDAYLSMYTEAAALKEETPNMEKKYGKGVKLDQEKGKYFIVPKDGDRVGPFDTMKDVQDHLKESSEQINEARPRVMSKKDFGKLIDSIENAHFEIELSLIDLIDDETKRKRVEKALQKAYDQYFKQVSEIERMLK